MRYIEYKFLLQELPWERLSLDQRVTAELKIGNPEKFMIVDQLAFKGIENFIQKITQKIGLEKGIENILHLENDRARACLYQEIYLEGEKNSLNDVYVEGGSFSRVKSNEGYVLRPKSEVFREIIKDEIGRLDGTSKIYQTQKEETKTGLFSSHKELLQNFYKEHFPPILRYAPKKTVVEEKKDIK